MSSKTTIIRHREIDRNSTFPFHINQNDRILMHGYVFKTMTNKIRHHESGSMPGQTYQRCKDAYTTWWEGQLRLLNHLMLRYQGCRPTSVDCQQAKGLLKRYR